MVNEKEEKRIITRRKNGWWQSPTAKQNMSLAQIKWNKENPEKAKERRKLAWENSNYKKFTGFRCLMRMADNQSRGMLKQRIEFCPCGNKILSKDKRNKFCSKACSNKYRKRPHGYSCPNAIGPKNCNWKNGLSKKAYKEVQINGKRKRIHQLVALKKYGLNKLPEGHVIHHINGQKMDNKSENLQLMTRKEHTELHANLMRKPKNC